MSRAPTTCSSGTPTSITSGGPSGSPPARGRPRGGRRRAHGGERPPSAGRGGLVRLPDRDTRRLNLLEGHLGPLDRRAARAPSRRRAPGGHGTGQRERRSGAGHARAVHRLGGGNAPPAPGRALPSRRLDAAPHPPRRPRADPPRARAAYPRSPARRHGIPGGVSDPRLRIGATLHRGRGRPSAASYSVRTTESRESSASRCAIACSTYPSSFDSRVSFTAYSGSPIFGYEPSSSSGKATSVVFRCSAIVPSPSFV